MEVQITDLYLYPVKSLRGLRRQQLQLDRRGLAEDRRWMVVDHNHRFLTQRQRAKMATLTATPLPGGLRLSDPLGGEVDVSVPACSARQVSVHVWADQVSALPAATEASQWLSERLGCECRLVYLPASSERGVADFADSLVGFADGYPALLTHDASLLELNRALNTADHPAVPMDRFRANIVVSSVGDGAAFDEDRWAELQVPGGRLVNAKPCERCMVITTDQQTGERDQSREPLNSLRALHGDLDGNGLFGINLIAQPDREDGVLSLAIGDRLQVVYQ